MEGHPAGEYLIQLLDATGDGTGSKDGAVDGSTPVTLKIGPQAGETFALDQLVIAIEDNAAVVWDGYGAIARPGLTNGCRLRVVNAAGTVTLNLLAGETVKRTFDWNKIASRWGTERTTTEGLTVFHVKLTTALIIPNGSFLEWVIRDNCSTLLTHTIQARGLVHSIPQH